MEVLNPLYGCIYFLEEYTPEKKKACEDYYATLPIVTENGIEYPKKT